MFGRSDIELSREHELQAQFFLGYPLDLNKALESLQPAQGLRITDPQLRQALQLQLDQALNERKRMMKLVLQAEN